MECALAGSVDPVGLSKLEGKGSFWGASSVRFAPHGCVFLFAEEGQGAISLYWSSCLNLKQISHKLIPVEGAGVEFEGAKVWVKRP